jgi:hypothetical protein
MHKISNNAAQSNASGLEAAVERDRRFFARHPFLSECTRSLMPAEFPRSMIPKEIPSSCEVCGVVTVRQIAPGVRLRTFADVFFAVTAADLEGGRDA